MIKENEAGSCVLREQEGQRLKFALLNGKRRIKERNSC